MRYLTPVLTVLLFAYSPHASAQQITGRFYPEKPEYLVGEPVTVMFEVANNTNETVQIADGNCTGLNGPLQVDNAPPKKSISLFGCSPPGVIAVSCLSSFQDISAGGKYRRRYLLQELDSTGVYHVRGARTQKIRSKATQQWVADLDVHSEFDITLRAANPGELEAVYQPLFDDFANRDFMTRDFAVSAVTQNPPLFAEFAILDLADIRTPATASEAIGGLKRLATPTLRTKLLELSSLSSPEYLRQPAIQALGEVGNPDDCEAILNIASQSDHYTQALAYAAAGRICRDRAVPALSTLLSTAGPQLFSGLIAGLGNSSSPSAVPILIAFLSSPESNVRRDAEEALATLTHKKSQYGIGDSESSQHSQIQWSSWWSLNSARAQIYSPDVCVAPQLLR